jgi:hypothetical protein
MLYTMKIRPVGAKLFYAEGQTHDEANSHFSQCFKRA